MTTTVNHENPKYLHVLKTTPRSELVGLKLLCLSDTHDLHTFMPENRCYDLPQADILVHAGDFTVRGTSEEVLNFQKWMEILLKNETVKHVVCCAGNHELGFEPWRSKHVAVRDKQEAVKESFSSVPNLHYLEDSGVTLLGLHFHGSPWTNPVRGKMDWAFQGRDGDISSKWDLIPETVIGSDLILVTHSPPYGQGDELKHCDNYSTDILDPNSTHDMKRNGKSLGHLGSRSLLERVLLVQPTLHVFGHFHLGYGISTMVNFPTTFINAAICDEDYQPVNLPILVEFVNET